MNVRRFSAYLPITVLAWLSLLMAAKGDSLTPLVYTGANGGDWEVAANWTPNDIPANTHAVYITNRTVKVASEAIAGRLEIIDGTLIVAGAKTTVLDQTPADTARTSPVGLAVFGDFWLAGDCSIGGVNQLCESYLTVGGDLTLSGSKALAVYAGPINGTTVTFETGGAQVTVAGTTTVKTGSWVYPDCDPYTGAPVIFDLQDLVIEDRAGFDASQRGWGYVNMGPDTPPVGTIFEKVANDYFWTQAPGAGTSYNIGGGYGGNSRATSSPRGEAYGYQYAPFQPGAPNGIWNHKLSNLRRGGGAVRIAAGKIVFNGALHADSGLQGGGADGYGASSGGGIWVTCDQIDIGVNARLSAVGGDIYNYASGGGGGRISIGIALSPEAITSLYAGEEPAELLYAPLTQARANVRGGQSQGIYASSGTATLVQTPTSARFLQVAGSSLEAGVPAAGYGTHLYPLNQNVTNSAPLKGLDPASDGSVRYACTGYTLADDSGVVAAGTTNWVSISMTNNLVLTWLWENREFRYRTAAGDHGRVRIGAETNTLFEQWMAEGATTDFTVEAIPDAGYRFLCWEGDLVMGQTFNPVLSVPTHRYGRNITARFVPLAPVLQDKTFTGANNGDWEVDGNWTPSGVPTVGDAVDITSKTVYIDSVAEAGSLTLSDGALIVAGSTTTVTAQTPRDGTRTAPVGLFVQEDFWLSGNVSIGGVDQSCMSYLTVGGDLTLTSANTLAVYAGPRDGLHPFKNGGARVTVAGATTVNAGCWIVPDCDIFKGHPVVFDLQDLTVAATGGFDATQRGWGYINAGPRIPIVPDYYERIIPDYWDTLAPGQGFDYMIGAGHGGSGDSYNAVRGKGLTYGNENAPLFPGSPNGIYNSKESYYRRGGGAVRVLARNVNLDGLLKADAGGQSNYGGSSGGSIWLTCDKITTGVSSSMSAQGGLAGQNYTSAGGGGRISVGLGLDTAAQEALAAGETPAALRYDTLAQLAHLSVNVSGGRGKLNGGVYAYAESGSATFIVSPTSYKLLFIDGLPVQAGKPAPNYGMNVISKGQWVTNSVDIYGMDAAADNRVRYRYQGYTVANQSGIIDSGTTNQVAIQLNEDLTLTWLWAEPEIRVDASAGPFGSILCDSVEGDVVEWLLPGATSTAVEAVPDSGYEFLYWLGDLPVGMATNNPLQFATEVPRSVQALFRLAEAPTTRVWNGGTATLGAWHDAANWLPAGNIPGKADHVVIDAGYCITTNYAECGSLTIGNAAILRVASWAMTGKRDESTASDLQLCLENVGFDEGQLVVRGDLQLQQNAQLGVGGIDQNYATALDVGGDLILSDTTSLAVYGGPTNQLFNFATGTASVRVGGLLQIGSDCWVYPTSDRYTGGSPRFDAMQLRIEAGGGFNATERGFDIVKDRVPETLAPGAGYSYNYGAGYGGIGGNGYLGTYGQSYGFTNAPLYPGSCNGEYKANTFRRGGGLVRLHVIKKATLAGSVIADGSQATTYGGPSGGGIWITAGRLYIEPGSLLQARGGSSNYSYSGGGGGRIALGIKLTQNDLTQLAETGQPYSSVPIIAASGFDALYPGVTIDVSAVNFHEGSNSAQPGTFVLLDATQQETMFIIR